MAAALLRPLTSGGLPLVFQGSSVSSESLFLRRPRRGTHRSHWSSLALPSGVHVICRDRSKPADDPFMSLVSESQHSLCAAIERRSTGYQVKRKQGAIVACA